MPPGTPLLSREERQSGLVRREPLLLLLVMWWPLRLLLLLWSLLPLLRRLPTPREGPPKLTSVAPPHSGLRGGLHRKFVQRAVVSEMTRLLAFETINHLGGGLIDRPAGRFPGKLLRGRLPARCRPTSTHLVALLIGQLRWAPFDSHLPYQIEISSCLPFQ